MLAPSIITITEICTIITTGASTAFDSALQSVTYTALGFGPVFGLREGTDERGADEVLWLARAVFVVLSVICIITLTGITCPQCLILRFRVLREPHAHVFGL